MCLTVLVAPRAPIVWAASAHAVIRGWLGIGMAATEQAC